MVDFILIVFVFIAFLQKHWYCVFIFAPIAVSFLNFLASSGRNAPIYDPLGKYMGSFLMVVITITLLIPQDLTRKILTYALAAFFMVNMVARTAYLKNVRPVVRKGEVYREYPSQGE